MKAFQKQTVKIRAIPASGPRAPPFFSINNFTFKVIRNFLVFKFVCLKFIVIHPDYRNCEN